MLRPPRELGSEAFSHAQSGIERPAIAPKVSLIASSKTEMAHLIWLGGQHLSEKATFGSARHDLSSVVSNCESSRQSRQGGHHLLHPLQHCGLAERGGSDWRPEQDETL